MTALCQNGWPVIPGTDAATEVVRVGGRAFRVRRGDVARVFEGFLRRYVAEVEPLDEGPLDDWSHAVRLVRDSATSVSNHAGGTAIDVNALRHQRGVYQTFSAAKIAALRRVLADFPVLRWGGDYRSTVDAMHFEINATQTEVRRFVAEMEDDMPMTDDDIERVAVRVADHVWARGLPGWNGDVPAHLRLAGADQKINETHSEGYLAAVGRAVATEVWDRARVAVAHLDPARQGAEVTMRDAVGRAAGVVANLLRDTRLTVRDPRPGFEGGTQEVDVATTLTRAAEGAEARRLLTAAADGPAAPPVPHRTTTPLEAP